ncbi:MAG: 30S ribosomal protein S17 [Candidatus Melainabacteria bacterium]|jgi:small subunit ribosomal protein S17|nr:30S ribosomal protein S17 [Candidatus Melainabacteria bacterium]
MPKRVLRGKVVSDKMNKGITVQVLRKKKHKLYQKVINFTTKFMAHDEENSAKEGDSVVIEECRPYSKHKTWILTEVTERAV